MTTTSQELFNSLVKNAIDFLNQSVMELKTNPKYSVINFCASVELFLKARLMLEHWSLIYYEPKDADKTKFLNGDFKSVGIEKIISRLEKIAHVQISKNAKDSFDDLREHRNKLIHFFHPQYIEPDEKVIEAIVMEQCKGWLHLHRLLTIDWKTEFSEYLVDLGNLNRLMLKQRSFLQAKYDSVLPEINKEIEKGAEFLYCQSCGFQSSQIIEEDNPLAITVCMVCENQEKFLTTPCPNCTESIFIYDLGEGYCEECQTKVELDYLLDIFDNKEFSSEGTRAYCSLCEYPAQPTVIQIEEDRWLCLYCLSFHEEVGHCEWCSELVTGDTTSTHFSGCIMCEGRDGWDKD